MVHRSNLLFNSVHVPSATEALYVIDGQWLYERQGKFTLERNYQHGTPVYMAL